MTGARLTFTLNGDESLIVAQTVATFGVPPGITREVGVGVTGSVESLLELADDLEVERVGAMRDPADQVVAQDLARRIRREVR